MSAPPAGNVTLKAKLVICNGARAGEEIPLTGRGPVILGRDSGATVQILDELISRKHTRVEHRGEEILLEDLQSSNGTYLNGRRVTTAVVREGDTVLVGKTRLEVVLEKRGGNTSVNLVDSMPPALGQSIVKRLDPAAMGSSSAGRAMQQRALKLVYEVSNLVNAENDLDKLLGAIMDGVMGQFPVERGVLFLQEQEELQPRVVRVQGDRDGTDDITVSRTVVQQCVEQTVSILSADAMLDDRFKMGESIITHRIRSVMCVPLVSRDRVLGAIYADNRGTEGAVGEADLELLAAVGKQAGVAIERARLHENLKHLFYSSVRTIVAAIEAKDPYTCGHSERVTAYSEQLAQELGYSGEFVERVRLAGLLHDVGKIGIPERILLKPDRLTPEEYDAIKQHPVIGARIVANLPEIQSVLEGVRHHHEFFDGTGYPDRLDGERIPMIARIVKVADAYDAMATDRPYRDALTAERILDEFRSYSGRQFDPRVATAMLAILEQGRLRTEHIVFDRDAFRDSLGAWPTL